MMINRHYKSTEFITGLRAIAVMMVFLIHSGGAGLREFGHIGNKIVDFGQYGVEIFFVISGYTIFYQIFYKKNTMKDFIIIRLFRISIPYFPIVFVRDSATLTGLLINKIMVFFGSISFSFYLIHLIVITLLKYYWNITLEEMFIVSLCIAVIISFIWYIIFENKIYRSVKKYYLGISK